MEVRLDQIKEYRSKVCALHHEHQAGNLSLDDVCASMENLDSEYDVDFSSAAEDDFHAESFFSDIGDRFKHIPQDLDPNRIKDLIKNEFQEVMQSSASQVARQAFKQSASYAGKLYNTLKSLRERKPDLTDAIDAVGLNVSLSVVTLHYTGFLARAEGLCRLLHLQSEHFEMNRRSVRYLLKNTGPTTITLGISGELFTSALSAGVALEAPLDLMIEIVDEALSHVGIPE